MFVNRLHRIEFTKHTQRVSKTVTTSRQIVGSTLLALSIATSACATTNTAPNLTPVARNAYNLTQLVDAIGILQTTAESSVPNKVLSTNTARLIVQFCVIANTTIGAVPGGWFPAVNVAYKTMKSQLTASDLSRFGIYLSTFETILNSFTPATP